MFNHLDKTCHICQEPNKPTLTEAVIPMALGGTNSANKLRHVALCDDCHHLLNKQIDEPFLHSYLLQTEMLKIFNQTTATPEILDFKQYPSLENQIPNDECIEYHAYAHHLLFWQKHNHHLEQEPMTSSKHTKPSTMYLFFNPQTIQQVSIQDIVLAAKSVRKQFEYAKKMTLLIHVSPPKDTDTTSKSWQTLQQQLNKQLKPYQAKCIWQSNCQHPFKALLPLQDQVSLSLENKPTIQEATRFLSRLSFGLLTAYLGEDFLQHPIASKLLHNIKNPNLPESTLKQYQLHTDSNKEVSTLLTSPLSIHIGLTNLLGKVICFISINHVLMLLDVCWISDLSIHAQKKLHLTPFEDSDQGLVLSFTALDSHYRENEFATFFTDKLTRMSDCKFHYEVQECLHS